LNGSNDCLPKARGLKRSTHDVAWIKSNLRDEEAEPSRKAVQGLWRHDRPHSPRGAGVGVGAYSVLQRCVPALGFSAGTDGGRELKSLMGGERRLVSAA